MAAPILNLDSLVDRPTVVINDKEYWLKTIDILSPLAGYELQRLMKRSGELLDDKIARELNEDEKKELDAIPNRACRLVLEAPDAVHTSLDKDVPHSGDSVRMLIAQTAISTFRNGLTIPPEMQAVMVAAAAATTPGSTGAK